MRKGKCFILLLGLGGAFMRIFGYHLELGKSVCTSGDDWLAKSGGGRFESGRGTNFNIPKTLAK